MSTASASGGSSPSRRAYEGPTLLLTGRGTAPLLRRTIDVLAAELPRARLLELDGAHAPHIVEMDRFLSELSQFQAGR